MDIYQQEKAERRSWRVALIGTSVPVGILISLFLAGCTKKPVAGSTVPTVIYADTTRTKLVHRAEESGKAIVIIQERTKQTVNEYEKSVVEFDSIRVSLP